MTTETQLYGPAWVVTTPHSSLVKVPPAAGESLSPARGKVFVQAVMWITREESRRQTNNFIGQIIASLNSLLSALLFLWERGKSFKVCSS